MIKKHKSILLFLLMLMALFTLMLQTAFAEEAETGIYYVSEEGESFYISVIYEKNDVTLKLKDPEGNLRPIDSGSINSIKEDNSTLILVEHAAAGQWTLVYDKGSNEYIEAAAYPSDNSFALGRVSVSSPDSDNKVNISFKASGGLSSSFNYEIRLGLTPEMTVYRTIYTGYGYKDDDPETVASVSFNDINSHDEYYIEVVAYYEKSGMKYYATRTSDKFAYKNPDTSLDNLEDFAIHANLDSRTITVDISSFVPYNVQEFYLVVKEDGKESDNFFVNTREDGNAVSFEYAEGTKEVECSVSIQYNSGRVLDPISKTISVVAKDKEFWLELPESGVLNSNSYSFSYANALEQKAKYFFNNDNYGTEITLNGSGNYKLEIPDGTTSIKVSYTKDDNTSYTQSRYLIIDSDPPELKIYEALDGITTDKTKIIITGKTEVGAILTCNDEPVELNENGSFSREVDLSEGENTFVFNSEDAAGNIATYALKINQSSNPQGASKTAASEDSDDKSSNDKNSDKDGGEETGKAGKLATKLPIIIGIAIGLFVICELLFIFIGKKKRTGFATLARAAGVLTVFSAGALIFDIIYYNMRRSFEKSEDYIDLALNSPKKAYNFLQTTKTVKTFITVFAIILGVAVVAMFVGIIGNLINDPEKKAARAEAKKQKGVEKQAQAARKAADLKAKKLEQAEAARKAAAEREAQAKAKAEAENKARLEAIKRAQEAKERAAKYAQDAGNAAGSSATPAVSEAPASKPDGNVAPAQNQTASGAPTQATEKTPVAPTQPTEKPPVIGNAPKPTDAVKASVAAGKKFCKNCGNQLDASAKFCTKCGKPQ